MVSATRPKNLHSPKLPAKPLIPSQGQAGLPVLEPINQEAAEFFIPYQQPMRHEEVFHSTGPELQHQDA